MTEENTGAAELSQYLIESFYKPLEILEKQLEELEKSQLGWINKIDEENQNFTSLREKMNEISELIQLLPSYIQKVLGLKKDMGNYSHRVHSLLQRINKIKLKKEKEKAEREERDRHLLAKPSPTLNRQTEKDDV